MRAFTAVCALLLIACSPSESVPENPPERPDFQVADRPPANFQLEELQVTIDGERRSYCLPLNALLGWFQEQGVNRQSWTQLDPDTWRLDGVDTHRKEHTVWIFQQVPEGVELVGYRDSEPQYADRDAEAIMRIYWPYLRGRSDNYVRRTYDDPTDCQGPYSETR